MFYESKWMQNKFVRVFGIILFLVIFLALLCYSFYNNSSGNLVRVLSQNSFPFEYVLLEGMPGYSQPERTTLVDTRGKVLNLGMYLFTGVNISDARTYFLSFYAPPKEGPAWLGWAYYPNDPEREGPILERVGEQSSPVEPTPVKENDDVLVGIYHTHSGESYAGDGSDYHAPVGEKGDVVDYGSLLNDKLEKLGIKTVHSVEINDKIYAESYNNSYYVAKKMLEDNPTMRVIMDIHRDGIPPNVGKSTVKIGEEEYSRILIIIGQKNPYWEKNLELAETIIKTGEEKYPGLFFPRVRYASDARYNQHLSSGALLLEIGSQLNTCEEAMNTVEPLAEILKECLENEQ